MARKVAETVQINLRLKEGLRRRVAREADRNKISQTKQVLLLIEDGLEQQKRIELDQLVADMRDLRDSVGDALHSLNKQGDLIRAAQKLVAAARAQKGVAEAVERIEKVLKMIDAEATLAMRKMHTTGADQ